MLDFGLLIMGIADPACIDRWFSKVGGHPQVSIRPFKLDILPHHFDNLLLGHAVGPWLAISMALWISIWEAESVTILPMITMTFSSVNSRRSETGTVHRFSKRRPFWNKCRQECRRTRKTKKGHFEVISSLDERATSCDNLVAGTHACAGIAFIALPIP